MADSPDSRRYGLSMNAADPRQKEPDMNATYGFHATMTALPGKGGELVDVLLGAMTAAGLATNESCVLYLVGRSASNGDVAGGAR